MAKIREIDKIKKDYEMKNKTKTLSEYMEARAKYEGVEWENSMNSFVEDAFAVGTRTFFGVELDDTGQLLSDTQQPTFFFGWTNRN